MKTHLPRRFSRRDLHTTSLALAMAPLIDRWPTATATAPATPVTDDEWDALVAELDAFVGERMAVHRVPGVAIGAIAGEREYAAEFGVTSVDHPLPVDADTLFQVGSITKTVTGTALMRLVERGEIDLEAPVRDYLPGFRVADPGVSAAVRLRHLVTHTAGWLDGGIQETGDGDDALARYVAGMAELPQIAPLGEYFSYNNAAVCLAGRAIEAVTGQTYEAAVGELVLQPLGMERAAFFPEQIMTEVFAVGHGPAPTAPEGEPVVLRPWALPRAINPAGGLVASATDLRRYARFHLGDGTANGARVLGAESLRRMQTPLGPGGTVPSFDTPFAGVGVNWFLWRRGGRRIVSHAGGTSGQQSTLSLVPDASVAVFVLTNAQGGLPLELEVTDWVLERLLGLRPTPLAPVPVAAARRAEYAGDYAFPDGSQTVRIREEEGGLRLEARVPGIGEAAAPLRFVGPDLAALEFQGLPVLTDFVREDAGEVAWVRFVGRLTPRVKWHPS
jgi:CubicO group peptidase (beta-lactamase class C family)